ncbi:MAG TPA: CoB--CoM heterodisulfide reductase iron-sulfur subunit B family protein [Patescibacteria group bacterium]|nr:CoB--CoM heterodisulfide reductase iron-sulfur subunit B family protein [Patescibacteria group bacterium]
MAEYALFLGCMIPVRLPFMESSGRRLLKGFAIDLVEMPSTGCCPDPSLKSVDEVTWTTLAARNLAIAEEMGLQILTPCNGCFETLKTVDSSLKGDTKLKGKVNQRLSKVGREYKGETEVKHLVEVLMDDVGVDRMRAAVVSPLTDLRVAVHHGCHLLRPSHILDVDDPIRPRLLDNLIELTGATSVPYYKSNLCCGAASGNADAETGKEMVRYKLGWMERAGVDCISVVCPTCFLQYDVTQRLVRKDSGDRFNIPVLYYPEMLLLAMGAEPEGLGLDMHRTSVAPVMERIAGGG